MAAFPTPRNPVDGGSFSESGSLCTSQSKLDRTKVKSKHTQAACVLHSLKQCRFSGYFSSQQNMLLDGAILVQKANPHVSQKYTLPSGL